MNIWEPDKFRLFVSHTSAHKQTVAAQKFGLAVLGVDAFVAHEDIDVPRSASASW
jgi:hypothetical protein